MTRAAILFDLDGTLIDSAPDLHAAAARMLEAEGQPPLSPNQIRAFIGNGVPKLVERIIGAADMDMADHGRLTEAFLDHYNANPTQLTRVYPDVMATLDALCERGFAMGLCTNKPEAPARAIVEHFGMDRYLEVIIGGDTLATKKPDPEGLMAAYNQLGGTARLYVGDSEVDAEAAGRADVLFALFTKGYRKSPVGAIPHNFAFEQFNALPAAAEHLLLDTVRI